MQIRKDSCVSCLLCSAFCPNNSIAFDAKLRAYIVEPHEGKGCLAAFLESIGKKNVRTSSLLRGTATSLIEDITNRSMLSLATRLKTFTEYMADNFDALTQWAGNAFRYITADQEGKVGYNVKIEGAKREIRLEICHLANGSLSLCKCDNRISFEFVDRFMIGRERARMSADALGFRNLIFGCYVVGEGESSYFDVSRGMEPSIEDRLREYELLMISSTALWFLVAQKLFLNKTILWARLLKELAKANKNHLITLDNECVEIMQRNTV
jgi:ferredoxin